LGRCATTADSASSLSRAVRVPASGGTRLGKFADQTRKIIFIRSRHRPTWRGKLWLHNISTMPGRVEWGSRLLRAAIRAFTGATSVN
jgi:hypothetical protein